MELQKLKSRTLNCGLRDRQAILFRSSIPVLRDVEANLLPSLINFCEIVNLSNFEHTIG